KLGKNIWFFGDFYSELDAIVYSYLSVLLNVNLPQNPLQVHIKECHNLVTFINRITKDIFQREGLTSAKALENDLLMTPSEREFMASKKTVQILAALFAILAMGGYALTSGILDVTFDRNQEDVYIYEDDDEGED
uniref:Metaxin glutathione S-transferase domain-containing protein n=1 Tax=Megaselia scalaris TaxID=36166 RepID=T1H3D6_MEGSC